MHAVDGAAIAGATLVASDCEAVTGPDGRFSVHCPPGRRTFVVSHPAFFPTSAAAGEVALDVALDPIPVAPGVYVATHTRLVELPRVALLRSGDETAGWAFCVGEPSPSASRVRPGEVRLLDNHDVDWRLFPIGEDGCAYRLEHANGEWWTSSTRAIPVKRESELAPGRSWLTVTLQPGRYALIDWYAGGPVPAPEAGDDAKPGPGPTGDGTKWRARELFVTLSTSERSDAH